MSEIDLRRLQLAFAIVPGVPGILMLELKILWSIGPKGKDRRMKEFS